ncbi:MAG: HAMP domain-containing protein [Candidatus Omnitrophica bacterium]|nr:HAMP domain-containing protein [Candidatus Omnitrophota bacterium]
MSSAPKRFESLTSKMSVSIRWKLILSIAIPLLGIYLAVLKIGYHELKRAATKQMERYLAEVAAHYAEGINGNMNVVAQTARSMAAFVPEHPGLSQEELFAILEANVRQNPLMYGASLAFEPFSIDPAQKLLAPAVWRGREAMGPDMTLRRMNVGLEAYDYLQRPWYKDVKAGGEAVWIGPYDDEGAGGVIMATHSVPMTRKGLFLGVAAVEVHLEELQTWTPKAREFGDLFFAILTRDGRFISHPNPDFIMKKNIFKIAEEENRPELAEFARQMLSGDKGAARVRQYPYQEDSLFLYAPIASTGWVFTAAVPESRVMSPVWKRLTQFSAVMFLSLGVILTILVIGSSEITRPIRKLSLEFRRVAAGDLEFSSHEKYPSDEIGQLADNFHRMVFSLRSYVKALTQETAMREAVESELRVAREIQASLLPRKYPPFPGRTEFDLHAVNAPARHVAGDFCDFFFVSEEELALVIADVAGKGVPAAMLMAIARTLVRDTGEDRLSPAEALGKVDRILSRDNDQGLFVSMFLAYYHVRSGEIRYANAGHPRPYVLSPQGAVRAFGEATGTVLGASADKPYGEGLEKLGTGETLVLYTDGVPEGRSDQDEFWGYARFEDFLKENAGSSPQAICGRILFRLEEFQSGNLRDDVTALALRRNV